MMPRQLHANLQKRSRDLINEQRSLHYSSVSSDYEIIKGLVRIERNERPYTVEEKEFIRNYTGNTSDIRKRRTVRRKLRAKLLLLEWQQFLDIAVGLMPEGRHRDELAQYGEDLLSAKYY